MAGPATLPVLKGARIAAHLRNRVFRNGWFDPASATVGLEGLTPHELQRAAASLAVRAGAIVKAVRRMREHASTAMALDTYADLFDADLPAVADALDHGAMQTNVAISLPRGF